jgi:hypothetical protein
MDKPLKTRSKLDTFYQQQFPDHRVANMEEDILSSVEDQPGTISRRLASQHNISYSILFGEY